MFALDKIGNYYVLDRYLRLVLSTHFINADLSKRGKYNFRCNVCGDSKKSKKKKRAWLLEPKRGSPAMFKCWNGCDPIPSETWLKRYFPTYYREYIKELIQGDETKYPSVTETLLKQKEKELKKIDKEREDVRGFVPILKGSGKLFDLAIKFCTDRRISKKVYEKFYVCEKGYKYSERLIIPFFDNKNQIYYFQARTLTNQEPKYLNRSENKEDSIYNIYNVDKKEPVIVLEGPLDSTFIKNSIAIIGLDLTNDKLKKIWDLDCWFLLDNDDAGKKAGKKLLNEGRKVFLWSRFAEDYPASESCKDVNDYVLKYDIDKQLTFKHFSNQKYWGMTMYDSIYL